MVEDKGLGMSETEALAIGIFMLIIAGIGISNLYNKIPVTTFRSNPIVALTGDVLAVASGTCFVVALIFLCRFIYLLIF